VRTRIRSVRERYARSPARQLQARSLELRTVTSYARLLPDQGRVGEAYELLAPGFGTKDLKEAKALLDELR
jgi:predicted ATPase